jgi:hypothetical protein
VRRIERQLDVFGLHARHLAHRLAGDRGNVVEILAPNGATHLPPMKLSNFSLIGLLAENLDMASCNMGLSLKFAGWRRQCGQAGKVLLSTHCDMTCAGLRRASW